MLKDILRRYWPIFLVLSFSTFSQPTLSLGDTLPPQNQPVDITQVLGAPIGNGNPVPVTCVSGCSGGSSGGGGGASWDAGVIVQYPIAIGSLWDGGVIVENFPSSFNVPNLVQVNIDGGNVTCQQGGAPWSTTLSGSNFAANWDAGVIVENPVAIASLWDGGVIVENIVNVSLGDAGVNLGNLITTDPVIGQPALPVRVIYPQENLSAFGEQLITQKVAIVNINFAYSINPFFVATTSVDGGTATQATSMATISTGTSATGQETLESKAAMRYIAGTGSYASFTAKFSSCVINNQQEEGLGDSVDGLFWGCVDGGFGAIQRNAGSDTFIPQSSFNVDTCDGHGASGYAITTTNLSLYKTEFGWHGSGPIKYEVFDDAAGRWIICHVVANGVTSPRFQNPTMPVHMRVFNNGNTSNVSVSAASMGAYREATEHVLDVPQDGFRGGQGASKGIAATEVPVISVQDMTTFNSITNRSRILITSIGAVADSTGANYLVQLRLNTTLTGSSFSSFLTNQSIANIDTSSSAISGGIVVFSTVTGSTGPSFLDITNQNLVLNPGDTITVTGVRLTGSSSNNLLMTISWKELFSG